MLFKLRLEGRRVWHFFAALALVLWLNFSNLHEINWKATIEPFAVAVWYLAVVLHLIKSYQHAPSFVFPQTIKPIFFFAKHQVKQQKKTSQQQITNAWITISLLLCKKRIAWSPGSRETAGVRSTIQIWLLTAVWPASAMLLCLVFILTRKTCSDLFFVKLYFQCFKGNLLYIQFHSFWNSRHCDQFCSVLSIK